MEIEVWLINSKKPGEKQKVDLDLPAIPRVGECIIVGELENYEVKDVIYRLNTKLRFNGRITVEAWSRYNK